MSVYTGLILGELWSSLAYAFLGLIIGSLIVFILYKVKYLKREYLILKIITKLYFVFLPILFLAYFWFAGSTWKTGNLIIESVNERITELQERLYKDFAVYVNEEIQRTIHLDEIPSNEVIVERFLLASSTSEEDNIYKKTLNITLKKVLDVVVGDDLGREKRIAALSDMSSKKAFEYVFDTIKPQLHRQIRQFLALFLAPLTLIFLVSLIIITIEIFVSVRYLNKIDDEVE